MSIFTPARRVLWVPTAVGSVSASPSASLSASPSASISASPSASISASPSASISASPSVSASPSASISASPSASISASPSASISASPSASISASPSVSASPSASISASPSASISASPSASISASPSASISASPSASPSVSASPSASPSVSASPSAVATDYLHIFSDTTIEPEHVTDNAKSVLIKDSLEVQWDTFCGGATNYTKIDSAGDVHFYAAAGLMFGSCYGNHIAWLANDDDDDKADQNVWYNISHADIDDGELHWVVHDGEGKLTVTYAGTYLITYSICFEDDKANDHIEAGIEISGSGSADTKGQCYIENKFASEEEHLGGGTILSVDAGATFELAIRTTDAVAPEITVHAVNLSVVKIGGYVAPT